MLNAESPAERLLRVANVLQLIAVSKTVATSSAVVATLRATHAVIGYAVASQFRRTEGAFDDQTHHSQIRPRRTCRCRRPAWLGRGRGFPHHADCRPAHHRGRQGDVRHLARLARHLPRHLHRL
ncbi:hypothetical protein MPL3356_380119 [Mesorhizobium plurifarium]|uniref:Uncharacterized protein n=1 Tax=Mesorhizobium plurifarium TaxID=69974 RepID=A0A090DXI7_MESPL|nr:hypothetical protein MPL3356_380119 [Mesorhizobium plurifarium]